MFYEWLSSHYFRSHVRQYSHSLGAHARCCFGCSLADSIDNIRVAAMMERDSFYKAPNIRARLKLIKTREIRLRSLHQTPAFLVFLAFFYFFFSFGLEMKNVIVSRARFSCRTNNDILITFPIFLTYYVVRKMVPAVELINNLVSQNLVLQCVQYSQTSSTFKQPCRRGSEYVDLPLQKGKSTPPKKEASPGFDTKLHQKVRLQFWRYRHS